MGKMLVDTGPAVPIKGGATFLQNKGTGVITVSRDPDVAADGDVTIASGSSMSLPYRPGGEALYVTSTVNDTDLRYL